MSSFVCRNETDEVFWLVLLSCCPRDIISKRNLNGDEIKSNMNIKITVEQSEDVIDLHLILADGEMSKVKQMSEDLPGSCC